MTNTNTLDTNALAKSIGVSPEALAKAIEAQQAKADKLRTAKFAEFNRVDGGFDVFIPDAALETVPIGPDGKRRNKAGKEIKYDSVAHATLPTIGYATYPNIAKKVLVSCSLHFKA